MSNALQEHSLEFAELTFFIDSGFLSLESVPPLLTLLDSDGFHPSPGTVTEPMYRATDIDSLLVDRYRDYEKEGIDEVPFLRIFSCRVMLDEFPSGPTSCTFRWMVDRGRGGEEIPRISISASIYTTPSEQGEQFELLSNKLYSISRKLYEHVQPKYGYIANMDVEHPRFADPAPQGHQFDVLCWVNFLGPGYSRTYGRDLLRRIPGYRTEALDDGGVLYQSRKSIRVENELRHRRWQEEVQQYLAPHGISIDFELNPDFA